MIRDERWVGTGAVFDFPQRGPYGPADDQALNRYDLPTLSDGTTRTVRSRPTIVIADDARSNIEQLESLLGEDYELLFANDGGEAVELASTQSPDLILLDVLMQEMDGFEACRKLKLDPHTAEIPVIFVTALNEEAQEMLGLDLGAVDFIAKPFSAPVVKARVRNHLELKRQRDILRNLSRQDGLTGIANRRRFNEVLEFEWRRGIRGRMPLSLVLLDIDHFKLYNDAKGHLEGDTCLRQIAQRIDEVIRRPGDLVSRYGGEEFAVVLAETPAAGARVVADRIQQAVVDLALSHPDSPVASMVTVSLGAATAVPTTAGAPQALIQAADQALYAAKAAGRNRTICSEF